MNLLTASFLPLLAHPGHGTIPTSSAAHYVFEPVHGCVALAAAGLACSAFFLARKLVQKKLVQIPVNRHSDSQRIR